MWPTQTTQQPMQYFRTRVPLWQICKLRCYKRLLIVLFQATVCLDAAHDCAWMQLLNVQQQLDACRTGGASSVAPAVSSLFWSIARLAESVWQADASGDLNRLQEASDQRDRQHAQTKSELDAANRTIALMALQQEESQRVRQCSYSAIERQLRHC